MGVDISDTVSLPEKRNLWKQLKKEHEQKTGEKLPRITTVAQEDWEEAEEQKEEESQEQEYNDYNEDLEEQLAFDYVQNYKDTLTQVYQDTISYIDSAPLNDRGNVRDPEFYFLLQALPQFQAEYQMIMALLDEYIDQYGYKALASALASSPQIDYARGLMFVPPSDMEDVFEDVLDILTSLTISVVGA